MPSDTPDWLPDTSSSVDNLVALQTFTIAHSPSNFFDVTATLSKSYQSFYLLFALPSVSGAYTVGVTAFDPSGNPYFVDTYNWSFAGNRYFAVDVPGTVGGSVRFRVSGQPLGTTVEAALYGSVAPRPGGNAAWRRDGRLRPLGMNSVHFTTAAGGTAIAAPGAGSRLAIVSGVIQLAANVNLSSDVAVNATVSGVLANLGWAAAAVSSYGTAPLVIPPMGIVVDDNTGIGVGVGNTPAEIDVSIYYDVIS